jgi:hypothetical protein
MPVARRQGHTGRALAVATGGVVLALGLALGLVVLANRDEQDQLELRLGDETFQAGEAESLAEQIGEGGPILFSDVASGERDIVLQHLTDDPRRGWVAVAARPPGVPRDCTIQWQADDQQFALLDAGGQVRGECDGRTFPLDGTGLPQYPVDRRDGQLYVDLNAADRPSSTSTSTTSIPG